MSKILPMACKESDYESMVFKLQPFVSCMLLSFFCQVSDFPFSYMTVTADHIAILVCDTPIPGFSSKFGDFGDNCKDLLISSGLCPYSSVCYQVCDIDKATLEAVYSQIEAGLQSNYIKGLLLTGSRADSFDNLIEWICRLDKFLVEVAFKIERLPIVGICFGHQILAKNLGADVGRNSRPGWELGTTEIQLNPKLSLFNGSSLNISECHQDIAFGVPEEYQGSKFVNIGSTNLCDVQGFVSVGGSMKVLTFQGHPEFHSELMLALSTYKYEAGIIDEDTYHRSINTTKSLQNQGVEIGNVIGKFLSIKI